MSLCAKVSFRAKELLRAKVSLRAKVTLCFSDIYPFKKKFGKPCTKQLFKQKLLKLQAVLIIIN